MINTQENQLPEGPAWDRHARHSQVPGEASENESDQSAESGTAGKPASSGESSQGVPPRTGQAKSEAESAAADRASLQDSDGSPSWDSDDLISKAATPSRSLFDQPADDNRAVHSTQASHRSQEADDSSEQSWENVGDDDLLADLRDAFDVDEASGSAGDIHSLAFLKVGSAAGGASERPASLSAGSVLADFEIVKELGRGGMGVVYLARQRSLNREVALKVLPDYARHGRTAIRRFRNEALAAARLNHTNVVPVYAQGEHEGHYYYAMKLIPGASLDRVIKVRPDLLSSTHAAQSASSAAFPTELSSLSEFDEVSISATDRMAGVRSSTQSIRTESDYRHLARLVAGVADGLAHAHENGVIHRDIKPHNLMLGPDRKLHITDFGLAHLTSEPHITITGEVMGTPLYLAPEQARGEVSEIGERTDIYALGVTLYELLTGERAFDAENREKVLEAVRQKSPVAPRQINARIPFDLETICLRAMEKDAKDRYGSASQLADDLRRFADGVPILIRRTSLFERGVKWVRRHKTISYAAVATFAVLAVSSLWASTAMQWKRENANAMAQQSYDWLVYNNYRGFDYVSSDFTEAVDAGANTKAVALVPVLVAMADQDKKRATEAIDAFLRNNPDDPEGLSLGAWVATRPPFDVTRRDRLLDDLTSAGGPDSPAGYFYYGMSIFNDRPYDAIVAFRQARSGLRNSGSKQDFPQASLNIARAHNQRMYRNRNLDGFEEAETQLRALTLDASDSPYGAYAYYLLSITYKLAAEIESEREPIRDPALIDRYANLALETALSGIEEYPGAVAVLRAKAEALEFMEAFEEARAVREAIIATGIPLPTCEAYHYGWRLSHWLGDAAQALQDVESHLSCDPSDTFYRWVYPTILRLELGIPVDVSEVADEIRQSSDSMRATLDSVALLWLAGFSDEAQVILDNRVVSPDESSGNDADWLEWTAAYCNDELDFDILEQRIADAGSGIESWAAVYFYAGLKSLADGKRTEALEAFEHSYRFHAGASGDSFHSRWLSVKLESDPEWASRLP